MRGGRIWSNVSDLAGQLVFATASGWVTDTSSSLVRGGVWHGGVQENLEQTINLEVGNFWARYVNGNRKKRNFKHPHQY